MPRSAPSAADQQLLKALADAGLPCSRYRLERWRQHRLLPRASLHHPGGGGSTAQVDEETWERAALMSAYSARGIAWQALGLLLLEHGHELPEQVLRECLLWRRGQEQRSVARREAFVRQRLAERLQAAPDELDVAEGLARVVRGSRDERAYFAANVAIVRGRYPELKRGPLHALVRSGMVWNVAERFGEELVGDTKALAQGWRSEEDAIAHGFYGDGDPARVLPSDLLEVAASMTLREYQCALLAAANTLAGILEQGACAASDVVLRVVTQLRVAWLGNPALPLSEEQLEELLERNPAPR